jgi:DNA helicase-2/ATP-dependent DNA helicase PcrA
MATVTECSVAVAHVTAKVDRLVGGAGTGKTTEILRIMTGALDYLGGDPMALGFASFTRAAREEAVNRAAVAWSVPPAALSRDGWFRTVHSTVYRCMAGSAGDPLDLESADGLEWLKDLVGVKMTATTHRDTGEVVLSGDETWTTALTLWNLSRASLVPLPDVYRRLRAGLPVGLDKILPLVAKYETAKRLDGLCDFSDGLLRFAGIAADPEEGYRNTTPLGEPPPVRYWLFDEQQDTSPLLNAVCRRLAAYPTVERVVLTGDPFQAIYGFCAASADCFMGWDATRERTMPKSYRCAAPILALGEKCLKRMRKGYWDRGIAPADHDGKVDYAGSLADAVRMIRGDEEWLLLARTNYHAGQMMAALGEGRVPFRCLGTPDGPTARATGHRCLWALQRGEPVAGSDWRRAVELLPASKAAGWLERGTKARWKDGALAKRHDMILPDELTQVGATPALVERIANGGWSSLVDYGKEFVDNAKRWGIEAATSPRIRVGTIHAAKGMEADNVAVFTATTKRIADAAEDNDAAYDEECRIGYVAVTRARRRVVLVSDGPVWKPKMEVFR